MYPYIHSCSLLFSIHASAKEATDRVNQPLSDILFSIHASAKEATCSTLFIARILACFSIHASAKEATGNTFVFGVHLLLFNPRLREGGDKSPTRSTRVAIRFSIHASAKEATYDCKKEDWFCNFQSTPPRRRRPQGAGAEVLGGFSIHASAKEATLCYNIFMFLLNFQSTPPRRRRPILLIFAIWQ